MNFVRKLNRNHVRNVSLQAVNAVLKRKEVSYAYLGNICRRNSNLASTISTNHVTPSEMSSDEDEKISNEILSKINAQIKEKSHSRLFAVIQLGERRFKITDEDIIAMNTFFPANVGDRICLEKVLLVGSTDFTLLGRPLISQDLLRIEATVIEKTYIVPRPLFRHGLHYRRLHWFRTPYTLIRINSIDFKNSLDELPEVEGIQNRVIY